MLYIKDRPGEDVVVRGARVLDPVERIDAVLDVRIDGPTSVFASALATGTPQRIEDIGRDERLPEEARQLLIEGGFHRTIIIPVTSDQGEPVGIVILSRRSTFSPVALAGTSRTPTVPPVT